ncbi:MAG: 50S ribosomal protein L4 [Elusimicrobia bacterium RIFCSPLOWO2_02_FULL_39_32]|nr:MAG: 50S ribosomal protein L4 [Elusimicrobia bacterium GWA2_38_7]OGR80851.1 MAG: 50S ribosomal protein L4 [Elusimicrobia bacterium RIFCSPHIGHO2_02_FULL_39_36]OGR93730.1 MAG: 50S ribosomal protein L4 [Elusimicrobia bacterium RIFCSPLOWO2_02_FULL_39_32]OGS00945.1 MAG: 50S ribosomal protein L4 [Elusimicrobia bacterium RIFCSPLOWO2_12_FULL_39_28]
MEISVIDSEGKVKGKRELNNPLFSAPLKNSFVLHEVVRAYLANQRKGTHSTLTRTEVSGGGKKPWKQKHTGRARSGSTRSPLWRGGGIIFGPKMRSYRIDLPKHKVELALSEALSSKANSGELLVSEKPILEKPKTKLLCAWLKNRGLGDHTLLVLNQKDEDLSLAARNLKNFKWILWNHLHPYHVLQAKKIVFTEEVFNGIK